MILCCCVRVQTDDHQYGKRARDDAQSCRALGGGRDGVQCHEATESIKIFSVPLKANPKPLSKLCIVEGALADRGLFQPGRSRVCLYLSNDDVRVHAARYLAFAKFCQLANAKLSLPLAKR